MERPHPMHWLSDRARTGLKELPANTSWLISRVLQPIENGSSAAESAGSATRDRTRRFTASVLDSAPVGDSVETRMKRARSAAERAQQAEEEALQAARESKQRSDYARQVNEQARAHVAEVKKQTNRAAEQRVAEARRTADEAVERERAAARADADDELQKTQAAAAEDTETSRRHAEASEERAKELVAEATHRLAEARKLADEATEAARAAAEEAHRQAQQLADDAHQQAQSADERVAAAERVRAGAAATAKETVREIDKDDKADGSLDARNKAELLDLAATIDVEGRTKMSKAELVRAISKASTTSRR